MPTPRVQLKCLQNKKISVRFSDEERARLKNECKNNGITLSELIRARVFGTKVTSRSDKLLLNEIRRTGSLIKLVGIQNRGNVDHEKLDRVLKIITNTINKLSCSDSNKTESL